MENGTKTAPRTIDRPDELELADGTRLVPETGEDFARLAGADRDHAFTLADVLREGGEPFRGYRLEHSD
jgi:hypothetical protein